MTNTNIFPWQKTQWQQLQNTQTQNHLPHALLFTGIQGIGKKHFAETFSQALLCQSPSADGFFCGTCKSCCLIQSKSHPDFLCVEPEEPGQMIKVDVVRSLVEWTSETALLGGYRIVILNPAHAMNNNAANALLKTLEEPAPKTFFILLSDQAQRLTATIRSRCQKIFFEKPDAKIALQFLADKITIKENAGIALNLANGAPFKALELAENNTLELRQQLFLGLCDLHQKKSDSIKLAAKLQEFDLLLMLNLLQTWLKDLMRFKLTLGQSELIHFDYHEKYRSIAENFSSDALLKYIDHVQHTYEKISGSLNLNRLLVLEELFILWVNYVSD